MKKILTQKVAQVLLSIIMVMYGGYLLMIFFSGKVQLLIHQDYTSLPLVSGFFLLLLGIVGFIINVTKKPSKDREPSRQSLLELLLLAVIVIGAFIIPPAPLSTSTALIRKGGLNDDAGLSRRTEQVARFIINTENRHLIEWVNLFSQYPDPSQYEGQKAKLSGFVLLDEDLPEGYFMISRFVLSCCAADARPVGIPVRSDIADELRNDQWIELKGTFITDTLDGEQVPVVQMSEYQEIEVPENPYATFS